MTRRAWWLAAFTVVCVLAALLLPRVAQPLAYHHFADRRGWLGVANFLDVASNVAFLAAGVAGLAVVAVRRDAFERPVERWPYVAFFIGLALTSAGSAYYHMAPDNPRLFWDRLPMTVAFMGILASQIADRVSVRAGIRLLVPMLAVGAASVMYWEWTERAGAGNVLPYAILQGYSMLLLLLVTLLYPSRYTRGNDLYYVFGWYAASKVLEALDGRIFGAAHVVSGHTLKHLAAAGAGFVVACMLARRRLRDPAVAAPTHGAASPP
ncbi:MAG: alkaline phytoceramidase [Burkholderiales bacterium]|nr:alkaline phytoceramidase [Burkholderiales bacterium]